MSPPQPRRKNSRSSSFLPQTGVGAVRYANGERYIGDWVRGKRHGTGLWTAPRFFADSKAAAPAASCHMYHGEWRDDRKHGRGLAARMTMDGSERHWSVRYESDALVKEKLRKDPRNTLARVLVLAAPGSKRFNDELSSASDSEGDSRGVDLLSALSDFSEIAAYFDARTRCGPDRFEVSDRSVTDPRLTRADALRKIERMFDSKSTCPFVVVCYTGHGQQRTGDWALRNGKEFACFEDVWTLWSKSRAASAERVNGPAHLCLQLLCRRMG